MLCHRCGTELAGAATCANCGAAAARRRFRPTLTAARAPDPMVLRAAALGLEKGEVVGEQFTLGDPTGEAPGGWLFDARGPGGLRLVVRFVGPLADAAARAQALETLEVARRLSHENIARCYAVGAHRDWLFIARERLEGLTLAKIIELRREKKQRFSIAELLPIFEPLRDALMHAHRHLPHGALDPAVIHILPAALKVADFGLAAALPGERFAGWHAAAARARTLAPEVLEGQAPTARSDVYGLGAIVYQMLTGQAFTPGAPPPSVVLGIIGGHPIDGIVHRATAPSPADRWPDVATLAEALSEQADGPPLLADDGERTRKVAVPMAFDTAERTGRFERAPRGAEPATPEGPSTDVRTGRFERPSMAGAEPSAAGEAVDEELETAPTTVPDSQGPPPVPASAKIEPQPAATPPSKPPPMPAAARVPPSASEQPTARIPAPPLPSTGESATGEDPAAGLPEPPLDALPAGPAGRGALLRPGAAGPSVVIDPAFARLDTQPPPADFVLGADRTPTQPVAMPQRRPWILRSNLGFGLLLLLIVGVVALAALWAIQRDEPEPGPTVQAPPEPVKPRQPPPQVVVAAVEADAAPAPTPPTEQPKRAVEAPRATTRAAAREPDETAVDARPTPRSEAPARREAPAEALRPTEPEAPVEPEAPGAGAPPPEAPAEPPPEPPPAPEPEAPPAAPEELRCPAGMVLVTHRGFPAGGKRRGAVIGPGLAAAREGAAYCIDAYEYPGRGKAPRTGVNFEAARGLCIARGHRLCTDAEWRRGCAGRKGGAWPYGSRFDPGKCNTEDADGEERAVAAGGTFRRCKSIRGLFDMSGNVAEWTADQTVRGGDFASADEDASCSGGGKRAPGSSRASIGFRCCTDFTE